MAWIIGGIVGIAIGWLVRHLMGPIGGSSPASGLEGELASARAEADTHRAKVATLLGEIGGHKQTITAHEATVARLTSDLASAKAAPAPAQVAPAPVAAAPAAAPAPAPAAPVAAAPAAPAPASADPSAAPAAPVSAGDIEDIEGIGPAIGGKLRAAGVGSIAHLLERGSTKQGRVDLATTIGEDEGRVLTWVNHADLMRVAGIGPQEAELLEAAGIDSPSELAQRNSLNLHAKVHEVNDAGAKKIVAELEAEAHHVAAWIESAKGLAKLVTH